MPERVPERAPRRVLQMLNETTRRLSIPRMTPTLAALLLAVTALGGCNQNKAGQASLMDDLMLENEELRTELSDRNRALDEANAELRDKSQMISQLRRELDDSQRGASGDALVTGFEGIPGVEGGVGAGEITATITSDLLFDSGKSTLKDKAKRSLDQVVAVLNSTHGNRLVRIGGHTDTDPIVKSGFKSNYHLGFERAFAVRDYLVSRGIDANRVYLASYGPDRPLSNKGLSRRVEIAVITN